MLKPKINLKFKELVYMSERVDIFSISRVDISLRYSKRIGHIWSYSSKYKGSPRTFLSDLTTLPRACILEYMHLSFEGTVNYMLNI